MLSLCGYVLILLVLPFSMQGVCIAYDVFIYMKIDLLQLPASIVSLHYYTMVTVLLYHHSLVPRLPALVGK